MKWMSVFIILIIATFVYAPATGQLANNSKKYEFRAVWVATVTNIDWPSKKGLSVEQQKHEFISLLEMHKRNGMNAVIVQIRPVADAFYASPYEPWSEFLNGLQGLPPKPFYDPLSFMIAETHKQGMEFHAWLNPYRAVFNVGTSSITPNHITRQHPEWFVRYGDKKYFNPGLPEVINYLADIVKDIIKRYDVDGIHMDDYFYPYRIPGKEFPDAEAYKKYGNGLSQADWRRSNCDSIVKRIHEIILEENPMVRFGISPFGVWRNASVDSLMGSNTRAGQTNYDDLYADILLWQQKDWIDYVVPQLYWEIGHKLCDYETLLKWWGDNSFGKHIYIGHGIYRAIGKTTAAWKNPNEFPNQIKLLRQNNNVQGSVFFSSSNFRYNPNGINDSLQHNYYRYPALIPPMNWIDTILPKKPTVLNCTKAYENYLLKGAADLKDETETVKNYTLYISENIAGLKQQPIQIIPADFTGKFQFVITPEEFNPGWKQCLIAVTCIDRENNESDVSNVLKLIMSDKGWVQQP